MINNSTTHVCLNSTSCHNIVRVPSVRFGYQISRKVTKAEPVGMDYLQVLLFVYLGLACLSLTLIGFCLKKPDIILNKRKTSLKEKLFEILEFMKTKTFLFTVMLMIFTGMQQALVIGDVTKIYGTETLGLGMVGYTMMCYGTAQLAMLLIIEKIQRKFRLIVFILIGFFVTQGLSYLLITWGPNSDSVYSVLGFLAAWGAVDAIWQSQVQGILVSCAMKKEPAVVCFRVCQGIGLSVIFLSSVWLTLLYKVFIVGATLLIGVIGYMIMEVTNNPVTPLEPRPFSV
ncbi:hypothetical protein FSP39_002756 [Pinctada imbricata]|uniref:Uncharacterized protein n=1 Tax=Pinctada imbricata TaxID=66713 RepID=A0AA88XH01_PINIB|nr:hypothetical protein FSP39_002756 [Pinctada imbricata]